jgi:uncharacterized protein RhaS with RHS repeats
MTGYLPTEFSNIDNPDSEFRALRTQSRLGTRRQGLTGGLQSRSADDLKVFDVSAGVEWQLQGTEKWPGNGYHAAHFRRLTANERFHI